MVGWETWYSEKIISLQCLWIKRLYDDSFHEWKVISRHLISKTFGKSFIFHSNLSFKKKVIKSFPSVFKEILLNWKTFFSKTPETPSCILSQFLWYSIYIQINEDDVHFSKFLLSNLNFASQLFDTNGTVKSWHLLKQEYHLNSKSYFQWLQLINSIPEIWKSTIKQSCSDAKNLIIHGHHQINGSRTLILEKLISKKLYQILISSPTNIITSVTYFETMFNTNNLDWTKMFILPPRTTCNTYLSFFEYNVLHKILFLNKKLYLFGMTKRQLCSYCNTYDETPIHLFCECDSTKYLWLQLNRHFPSDLTFPVSTPQAAILGLFNDSESNIRLINHILLLFKLYIYKSRNQHRLNMNDLLANILKIKKLKNVTVFGNAKK